MLQWATPAERAETEQLPDRTVTITPLRAVTHAADAGPDGQTLELWSPAPC